LSAFGIPSFGKTTFGCELFQMSTNRLPSDPEVLGSHTSNITSMSFHVLQNKEANIFAATVNSSHKLMINNRKLSRHCKPNSK
jgi:hypothetical protein